MKERIAYLYLEWDRVDKWGYWIYQDNPAQKGTFEENFFKEYPVTQQQYMSAQRRLGEAAERLNSSGVVPTGDSSLKYFPTLEEIVGANSSKIDSTK